MHGKKPDIQFQTTDDFVKEWEGGKKEAFMFSKKQRKILIVDIVIIFLMGLFPPWLYTFKKTSVYSENSAGYHFLIDGPPQKKSRYYGVKLDFSRLFLQCLLVVIATGLGMYLSKRTDDKLE